MMHEYAKEMTEGSGRTSSPKKPFLVRKFKTLVEVYDCLKYYQEQTVTHFIKYNRDKNFGNEEYVPNIAHGRIHYWSHTGKCGVPIEYDGVPFMHVGRWVLMCHQGHDTNRSHKHKYQIRKIQEQQESGVTQKSRSRSQVTKKVNCPAEIYVAHVMKFPQHKVPRALLAIKSLPTDHMRKLAKKKMISSFRHYPGKFVRESWYYVRLPDPTSHEGHPVLGVVKQEAAAGPPVEFTTEVTDQLGAPAEVKRKKQVRNPRYRTKEPVDPRVLQKMYELTRQGVSSVKMMQEGVAEFVREELFPCEEPPPPMYRRYNPTPSDIQNAMYKVKQEMRLEGRSILQYRCAALVREITELVVQTDSEEYLTQLEEQLRNIYTAVRSAMPIQEVAFRAEKEGEKGLVEVGQLEVEEAARPKRARYAKHPDQQQQQQQAELSAATYHLSLQNQEFKAVEQQLELDEVLEHEQVHEIIQHEDGTVMEVFYYQPSIKDSNTIIIQPHHIKQEPAPPL